MSLVKKASSLIPVRHDDDKRRYILSWVVFGGLLLAYAIYLAVKTAQSYANPGATIGIDPTQPPFPVFAVCFYQLAPPPNDQPIVYASYQQGKNEKPPPPVSFNYSLVNLTDSDTGDELTCIQFNQNGDIKGTTGALAVQIRAGYPVDATRSVVQLFILPQALSPFTDATISDVYDVVILPTSSLVEATWTVENHIDLSGHQQTHYAMVQQVETLTTNTKQKLVQNLASQSQSNLCDNKHDGTTCTDTITGEVGVCEDSECDWLCLNTTSDYIPISYRCDGWYDCIGSGVFGSDELGCNNFFHCRDGENLTISVKCNGVTDCLDGSDESNCTFAPLLLEALISPYTQYVTTTTDTVTFGWESFFAALASGWSAATLGVAFLFPKEAEDLVKWRLRKDSNAEAKKAEAPA